MRDHSNDTRETEPVRLREGREKKMYEKRKEKKKSRQLSRIPLPLLPSSVTGVSALAVAAGTFSLAAPSAPAGMFRMSLEVREDPPHTAQPVHDAACPPAPGLIASTSFSVGRGRGTDKINTPPVVLST